MSAYKNLFDTHLHTEWSGDSSTPVLDQINRAKELGLSGITITDHMDLDFPETPDRFKLDLPNYLSTLKKIALQESSPDFEILIGMELGLQPQCVDDNHSLLRNYNFDYIIGSLHLIDGMDPYYDSFYDIVVIQNTVIFYIIFIYNLENNSIRRVIAIIRRHCLYQCRFCISR